MMTQIRTLFGTSCSEQPKSSIIVYILVFADSAYTFKYVGVSSSLYITFLELSVEIKIKF